MVYTIFAVVVFFIVHFTISFCDGYFVLNSVQSSNIEIYVIPSVFFILLLFLLFRIKKMGKKKLTIGGLSYIMVVLVVAFLIQPMIIKVQLYGFRIKARELWRLEELFDCSESFIYYYNEIIREKITIFQEDELSPCLKSALSSTKKKPNIVMEKGLITSYLTLEFEHYSISFIPSKFPILEFQQSIKNDRIIFSYSNRLNISWR